MRIFFNKARPGEGIPAIAGLQIGRRSLALHIGRGLSFVYVYGYPSGVLCKRKAWRVI